MIRLIKWIFVSVIATILFSSIAVIGFILGQIKYLFQKGVKGYFKYLYDMVGGIMVGISYMLEGYSIGIDIIANASGGEGLEWLFNKNYSKDVSTLMGKPNATISAGIGDMKHKGHLNTPFGLWINNALNIAFNQKDHGEYARLYYKAKKEIEDSIEPYK